MAPSQPDQSSPENHEPSQFTDCGRRNTEGDKGTQPLKLPSANEFSPRQIGLRTAIEIVDEHAGDRGAVIEALRKENFADAAATRTDPGERLTQQRKRAYNVLVGMGNYGLISLKTAELTQVGRWLLDSPDEDALYETLARHILRECHGIEVVRAMHDLKQRQENPTKERLHHELSMRGFQLSRATTDHTQARAWLEQAGVVQGTYGIDEERFAELAGVRLDTLDELAGLTDAQVAFLRTLRRLAEGIGTTQTTVQTVLDQAELEYGNVIPQDRVRAEVVNPLAQQDWLDVPPRSAGRGGKSGPVAATEKLLGINLERLLQTTADGVPADLRPRINVPLATIREDLVAVDKHTRGVALELMALRLAFDLALRPVGFRARSSVTGFAEVDLIAESVHLHYSRWLFQCKNTDTVQTSDIAKEAGMTGLLHAHVIVMVTTGMFTDGARAYAHALTAAGPLQAILVDGGDLWSYLRGGPQRAMKLFSEAAANTASAKSRQMTAQRAQ